MRFTSITQSQSLGETAPNGPPAPTPALLQTTCTLPNAAIAASAAAFTEARLATSATTPSARICRSRSPSSARSSASGSMSASITAMPSAPNACAIDSPMPLAPPVMKATLPFRSCIGSSL